MPRATPFDPLVFTSKTVFLQRVQEAVCDGYRHWTMGSVPLAAAQKLARKFKAAYAVDVDKNERYRRKGLGMGNARLLFRWSEEQHVDFMLLVSKGDHPAHQMEKLIDSARTPVTYRELELVALTFAGRSKPSMTWRMRADTVEAWQKRLHASTAHYNRRDLFLCWHSLYRTPGFAGIRKQVGDLVSFWRREWRQLRGDAPCPVCYPHNDLQFRGRPGISKGDDGMYWTERGFPSPAQCPKLFYIRKQRDVGERLSKMVKGA
jgi:hypothetical protein